MFPSQRPPLPPGTQIGKYVITSHLGSGGNGAVYAGLDTVLGRPVALKLLHSEFIHDPHVAGRFRQEAQAMAQLNHPHVVTVHDFVGAGDAWAIVMELVEGGETLASILRREGRLAPARAVRLAKQVAAGLGHAHRRGIVHRDVKPANVMIVRQSAGASTEEIAKISDFGIARLLHGEKRTQGQLTLGTLWYLAPEQARSSSVDARADVYALGASLYEALTGRVVFPYDNVARVLAAALGEAPTPPSSVVPGLSPTLDAVVLCLIAKSPDERPADGEAARALLEEAEWALAPPSPSAMGSMRPSPAAPSIRPLASSSAPRTTPEAFQATALFDPSRSPPRGDALERAEDAALARDVARRAPPAPQGSPSAWIPIGVGIVALLLVIGACAASALLCVGSAALR